MARDSRAAIQAGTDQRRRLLDEWERSCRVQGDAGHCSGPDADFLVSAMSKALRHGQDTPELGRAARTWGAGFSGPVEALSAICRLREAVTSLPDDSGGEPSVSSPAVVRVFDQIMMEAVDAASANLRSEARVDSLTGCANRRALDEDLGHALASSRRSGLELTVAIVDLDGLKSINDSHGHMSGDAALIDLVATLRQVLRDADTMYRSGGDEFVVLAPFTDPSGARALMRRAEQKGGPSFSWGVASTSALGSNLTDGSLEAEALALLTAADADLYTRRRAQRRAAVRTRRKRRAITVVSVAASAATVASGAALAAALAGGSSGSSPARSNSTEALPSPSEVGPHGPFRFGPRWHSPAPAPGPSASVSTAPASGQAAGGASSVVGQTSLAAETVSAGAHLVSSTSAVVSTTSAVAPGVTTAARRARGAPIANGAVSHLAVGGGAPGRRAATAKAAKHLASPRAATAPPKPPRPPKSPKPPQSPNKG